MNNRKTIKRLLREIGFHHCRGQWIYNHTDSDGVVSKDLRLSFNSNKKNTGIQVRFLNTSFGNSTYVGDVQTAEELLERVNDGIREAKRLIEKWNSPPPYSGEWFPYYVRAK